MIVDTCPVHEAERLLALNHMMYRRQKTKTKTDTVAWLRPHSITLSKRGSCYPATQALGLVLQCTLLRRGVFASYGVVRIATIGARTQWARPSGIRIDIFDMIEGGLYYRAPQTQYYTKHHDAANAASQNMKACRHAASAAARPIHHPC